jgi:hypothetical protein
MILMGANPFRGPLEGVGPRYGRAQNSLDFMAGGLGSGTQCIYFVPLTPSPPPPPELNRNQQRCIRYASVT